MSAKAGKDVKVAMPPVCLLEIEGEVRFKGNKNVKTTYQVLDKGKINRFDCKTDKKNQTKLTVHFTIQFEMKGSC